MERVISQSSILQEDVHSSEHALVSWKAVFAGLLVSMICYAVLMALGTAIGGSSAVEAITSSSTQMDMGDLAGGLGVWLVVSMLISLFVGSYFAARISTFITSRIGAAQGLVIAALFFGLTMFGAGTTIGFLGKGIGNIIGAAGGGTVSLAMNSTVQETVQKALNNLNLKSDPNDVAKNMALLLLRGDTQAARNYLAYQTGLTPAALNGRLAQLQTDFNATVKTVGAQMARVVAATGWSLFALLVLGIGCSVAGGVAASRANLKQPLARDDVRAPLVAHPVT